MKLIGKANHKKTMKIAFFAGRPYQIFTAVVLNHNRSDISADLFIENNYDNAYDDYIRIKNLGYFNKVYLLKSNSRAKDIYSKFSKFRMIFLKIINKKIFIKKSIVNDKLEEEHFSKIDYTEIYLSSPSAFPLTLIKIYSNAKVIIFEDGLGTYVEDIDSNISISSKLISYITKNGVRYIKDRIDSILLYNCDIFIKQKTKLIKPILFDSQDTVLINKLNLAFNYNQSDEYKKSDIILLSQGWSLDKDKRLLELFGKVYNLQRDGNFLYRLHPSEVYEEKDKFVKPDLMWELVCLNEINEKHVLISIFSTSVFSPFNLYRKTPYIIFVYKILSNDFVKKYDLIWTEQVIKFMNLYPKMKIFIPENIDELEHTLILIKNNKGVVL